MPLAKGGIARGEAGNTIELRGVGVAHPLSLNGEVSLTLYVSSCCSTLVHQLRKHVAHLLYGVGEVGVLGDNVGDRGGCRIEYIENVVLEDFVISLCLGRL